MKRTSFVATILIGLFGTITSGCSTSTSPVRTEATPTDAPTATTASGAFTTVASNGTAVSIPTTVPGTIPKGETRLTTAQASVFSRVLVKGRDDKGAHFSAIVPFGPAATFTIVGDVDWINYQGSGTLSAKRSDKQPVPDQKLYWSNGTLVQNVEGIESAMAAKGRTGVKYVSRPIKQEQAALDRVIILINSMANTRAENPILLRQRNDVSYAGQTTFDNVTVDRFRYGNTQYWIGPDGGLRKLIAIFKTFTGPVEITFTDKGPKTFAAPAAIEVVAAAEIPDVLKALTEIKSAATPST
jgi:hypothetical protein